MERHGEVATLYIIFDGNRESWASSSIGSELPNIVEHVALFCSTFLTLHPRNRLRFYAHAPHNCELLYPSTRIPDGSPLRKMHTQVLAGVKRLVGGTEGKRGAADAASALSRALCRVNRESMPGRSQRFLIIHNTVDTGMQYISLMNCVFSCQKLGIPVDVVSFQESTYLAQAAHLTKGASLFLKSGKSLYKSLCSGFLADGALRSIVRLPSLKDLDLRATCFDTGDVIEMGFVCSVCLSIYSKFVPACTSCGMRFQLARLPGRGKRPAQAPLSRENSAAPPHKRPRTVDRSVLAPERVERMARDAARQLGKDVS